MNKIYKRAVQNTQISSRRTKGVAMVELVMVMLLLTLFGVTIFTLIIAGADTQSRIMQEKDAQADARVALSYINVRLRQNDSAGKISVQPIEWAGTNGILLRERTFEYEYDTWIYIYNGMLYECLTNPYDQPEEFLSFPIIPIEGLDTVMHEDGSITNTVYYMYNNQLTQMSSTVYLRAAIKGDEWDEWYDLF
jgi:hypothetical protein